MPNQDHNTTWIKLLDDNGGAYLFLHCAISQMQCSSPLGFKFIVDACSAAAMCQSTNFNYMLNQSRCPLCQLQGLLAMPTWQHLLREFCITACFSEEWHVLFVPRAHHELGVPLDLYSMSHLVVWLLRALVAHLQQQHQVSWHVPPSSTQLTFTYGSH